MVIALEGKPISAYLFRLFLLSLGPTYGRDITSKAISKLVTLPREYTITVQFECIPRNKNRYLLNVTLGE